MPPRRKRRATEAVRRLAQHRAGITHLSMRVSWPGMGHHDILAGIALLGRRGPGWISDFQKYRLTAG
jgi:hypothetical protein